MFVKKRTEIRANDVNQIIDDVAKTGDRLLDALKVIYAVHSTVMNLDVEIYDGVDGIKLGIGLSGIEESSSKLRCAINDLEEVLKRLEDLPLAVANLQKKIETSD